MTVAYARQIFARSRNNVWMNNAYSGTLSVLMIEGSKMAAKSEGIPARESTSEANQGPAFARDCRGGAGINGASVLSLVGKP